MRSIKIVLFSFSLIFLTIIRNNLTAQENYKNIGLDIGKSFSAMPFATRINMVGVINNHEFETGIVIAKFKDENPDNKKLIHGGYLGYKYYPLKHDIFNLNFYFDNKLVSYEAFKVPTKELFDEYDFVNQNAKVKFNESILGVGFNIYFLKHYKIYGDCGIGYMWKWYKYDGYPEYPRRIDCLSAQARFGFSGYLFNTPQYFYYKKDTDLKESTSREKNSSISIYKGYNFYELDRKLNLINFSLDKYILAIYMLSADAGIYWLFKEIQFGHISFKQKGFKGFHIGLAGLRKLNNSKKLPVYSGIYSKYTHYYFDNFSLFKTETNTLQSTGINKISFGIKSSLDYLITTVLSIGLISDILFEINYRKQWPNDKNLNIHLGCSLKYHF